MTSDDSTSGAELSLRSGSAADGAAVARVFGAAWARLPFVPKLHTLDEDVAFFREQLATWDSLLAEVAGELAAFATFGPGRLHHIYVHPAHQGRGLGSVLLERVQRARPAGFDLWTFQANAGARRFYERHGFACVETTDGSGNEERTPDARYAWGGLSKGPLR